MKIISALTAGVGIVISLALFAAGFTWMSEDKNYRNPGNWFLAAIALLLLCKAIQFALDE